MPMATYMRRPQANHSPGVCSKASVDGSIKPFDILQSWAEQPVFTWSSQLSAPTACPATSKGKQRTGTSASPDVDNSVLEDQYEGYRRCRSDGGVSIARPAPSPLPGRTYSASVEPSDLAMYCGNMSAPKKLHHYFSSKAEKLKDLSKDGNCNSSSSFDLAVDCTAVVEIPTSINSCILAVYSTAADSVLERTPGYEAPPHVATVAAGCDPITAALRERLHQLEKRNRALEKKLHQLEKQQQQLLEQEQQTQQQQPFSSSSSIPVQQQQQQSPGLDQPVYKQHQATDVHIQDPTTITSSTAGQSNTLNNSSICYVVQAPPSPAGQQQQQTARADAAIDTLPAASAHKDPSQQQQQTSSTSSEQFQPPRTPELADRISSSGSSSSDSSNSGSDEEQQQDGLDLQSGICGLQREVSRLQMLNGLLQSDYSDLEFVLKETERQRREYAARYAFVVLDHDNDGYISTQQVENYELFATYAPEVLQSAFRHWRWQSGFPGYLNIEDFVRFVEYADDRSSRAAQHFWFSVLDTDGDGHLGWQDMKQLYSAVDKSSAAYVVGFEDLMNQIRDMVEVQKHPELGFTCSELIASKLGAGVIALLTNHNNMLLQRSTAEWGRGDFPL